MSDKFGINRSIKMAVFNDPDEAIEAGYNYSEWGDKPIPLGIDKAVVVRKGMVSGAATVDLLLVDEHGNKYVTLITANLLAMVAAAGKEN